MIADIPFLNDRMFLRSMSINSALPAVQSNISTLFTLRRKYDSFSGKVIIDKTNSLAGQTIKTIHYNATSDENVRSFGFVDGDLVSVVVGFGFDID